MAEDFKKLRKHDQVELIIGGATMLVESTLDETDGQKVVCIWHDDHGTAQRETYPAKLVLLVERDGSKILHNW